MSKPAVAVAAGIWRLPTAPFDSINSYALVDDDGSVTLIDTGLRRASAKIVAGLAAIGRAPSDVTRILLTHAHFDHAGGVSKLREATAAPVALHLDDAEIARTGSGGPGNPASRLGRLVRRIPALRIAPFEIDEPLSDGQVLDIGGGLRVVHTPGHTSGHVSFLHEDSGVLITGDCVFNVLGVRTSPAKLCVDGAQNRASAALLADLPFSIAAFTHGPQVTDRARERVAALTRS